MNHFKVLLFTVLLVPLSGCDPSNSINSCIKSSQVEILLEATISEEESIILKCHDFDEINENEHVVSRKYRSDYGQAPGSSKKHFEIVAVSRWNSNFVKNNGVLISTTDKEKYLEYKEMIEAMSNWQKIEGDSSFKGKINNFDFVFGHSVKSKTTSGNTDYRLILVPLYAYDNDLL